jgi:hypothetical protein
MRAGVLALLALLASSCGKLRPCSPNTVFLSLTFDSTAAVADELTISLSIAGGSVVTRQVAHPANDTQDQLEIDFPGGYSAGQTLDVTIVATSAGSPIGSGSDSFLLAPSCTSHTVPLVGGGTADMSGSDAACVPTVACLPDNCGSIDNGCGVMVDCGACSLNAVTPSLANSGDTITLEGRFDPTATMVTFPGGKSVAATALGPNRATVTVPPEATAGDLTVSAHGSTTVGMYFRRVSFTLGLQGFRSHYEQLHAARALPTLPVAGGVCSGAGSVVFCSPGSMPNTIGIGLANADGTINAIGSSAPAPGPLAGAFLAGRTFYYVSSTGISGMPVNADGSLGAAFSAGTVPTNKSPTFNVIGNHVYAVGGFDASNNAVKTVERASFNADHTLTAFADAGVQLTQPRALHSSLLIGNKLYVLSGLGTAASSVESASIAGDGALGAFADAGVTLSSGRPGANAVTIGHALYVIGGIDSSSGVSLGSIARASIRSDGGLDPFSDAGVGLVNPRHFFGAGIFGNYLYVFGGHHNTAGGIDLVTVERASIDVSSGLSDLVDSGVSLGSGKGRWNAAAVVLGNWLYVIGGTRNNAPINSVDRSPIAPDGTLGAFAPAPNGNLMTARAGAGLAVIGGTLYVLGGNAGMIESASIGADGTLGAFANASSTTSASHVSPGVVMLDAGSIYLIGGNSAVTERATYNNIDGSLGNFANASNNMATSHSSCVDVAATSVAAISGNVPPTPTVDLASFDPSTGTIATWSNSATTYNLGTPRNLPACVAVGTALYALGGGDGAGQALMSSEKISLQSSTGALTAPWSAGPALPAKTDGAAIAAVGNYVYLIGGTPDNSTASATILRATLQ